MRRPKNGQRRLRAICGLRAALIVFNGAALAGCAAATPRPATIYYFSEPVPNPPAHVHHPAVTPTPASASPSSNASPAAPPGVPAAAQPPAAVPPAGGTPHDASEYIEPPAR